MDGSYFNQLVSSQAPLASGVSVPPTTGFEGVPGFNGSGLTSMMMQMGAAPVLTGMMRGIGMTPMGLLHDQNAYDVFNNRRFTEAYRQTMTDLASSERSNYMRTFQGLAAMTGTPFGARQRQAAGALADFAVSAAPVMAEMFPDFYDQMGGARGSAVVMSQRMSMGSRYRMDPTTGRLGFSGASATALSRSLYADMFEGNDISGNQGFSSGQMGGLYDELSRRGMVAGPSGSLLSRTRDAVADFASRDSTGLHRAAANMGVTLPGNLANLGAEDLDKLRLDPGIADKLRSFDAESVKRSLRAYTGAIAAVRDIFGDIGMPNAPMSQLVAGLEVLSNNQTSQLSPDRLAQVVRKTHELSKVTGVGMDAAMMIQQHAVGRAEQLGLNPFFGIQAGQGSMAWGGAYRGLGFGAATSWDLASPDKLQQMDANLRVQASGSRMANMMNLSARLGDTLGGFQEGSTAAAYVQAVRDKRAEFVDPVTGRTRSLAMQQGEFAEMLTGAKGVGGKSLGLTGDSISAMLGQNDVNAEYGAKYDTASTVRGAAGRVEFTPWLAGRMKETLSGQFGTVLKPAAATHAAEWASSRLADFYMNMSREDFADPTRRNEAAAGMLSKAFAGTDVERSLTAAGVDPQGFYKATAERSYGHADRASREGMFAGLGGFQNAHALLSPAAQQAANRISADADFAGRLREKLAPFARGSLVRRTMESIKTVKAGDKDALTRVISEALGGISDKDLRGKIGEAASGLSAKIDKLHELHAKVQATPDGPQKKELMAQLKAEEAAIGDAVAKATEFDADAGVDKGPTKEDAVTAVHGMTRISGLDATMGALRTGTGDVGKDKASWGKFWTSESGATYRESVSSALGDVSALASAAIGSKELLRKFGPQALEKHASIQTSMSRLKDLAHYNTNGDLSRLIAGDLNVSGDAAKVVNAEVASLRVNLAADAHFFEGKGWVGDPKTLARKLLGPGAKEADIEKAAADIAVGQKMSPRDLLKADRLRAVDAKLANVKLGSPEHAALRRARVAAEKELGGDSEAKLRALTTMERGEGAAKSARDKEATPTADALLGVYKAFGVTSDKAGAEKDAAGMVGVDKERLARLTDSAWQVRSVVALKEGDLAPGDERRALGRLVSAYGEATNPALSAGARAVKVAQLRKDYVLGSDSAYKDFQDNYQYLKASGGLDAVLSGDDKARRDKLGGVLKKLGGGEYRTGTSDSGGGAGGRVELTGTLKLDFEKGTADVRATAPDFRHTAPA